MTSFIVKGESMYCGVCFAIKTSKPHLPLLHKAARFKRRQKLLRIPSEVRVWNKYHSISNMMMAQRCNNNIDARWLMSILSLCTFTPSFVSCWWRVTCMRRMCVCELAEKKRKQSNDAMYVHIASDVMDHSSVIVV